VRAITLLLLASIAIGADHPLKSYKESQEILHGRSILWQDPGIVDFRYGASGPNGAPRPPFVYVKEDTTGTNPKVLVRDADSRVWDVKFGEEARPDTFVMHLVTALGYFGETNYFVPSGILTGAHGLKRARSVIDSEGRFTGGARFQLRSKDPEYLLGWSWSWTDNPFLGTPEFNGLRIVTMLVSNWDNKDFRDANESGPVTVFYDFFQRKIRGSNNAIYRDANGQYLFFIDDWGATMGTWGDPTERSKWDYPGYLGQSKEFVRAQGGRLEWGFQGIHTPDMTKGIGISDVRWLMQYLGRISDEQIRDGLLASGAMTAAEASCYTRALRIRIEELRDIARGHAVN
jgi:hypothetical protein